MNNGCLEQTVLYRLLEVLEVPDEQSSNGLEREIMQLFVNADIDGVYFFESSEMKNRLQMFQPTCFNDLVLLLALQEGEAKVLFDRFISNKNGRHNHFPLSSLLDTTYGIILFDDQYTNVLEVCAGLDEYVIAKMRLAMRQGQKTELAELIHVFADGCKRNSDFWQDGNFAQALVRRIWFELIEQSPFLVNRQSVISRMQISWKLAWMKLQYPGLFEELRNGSGGESYGNN